MWNYTQTYLREEKNVHQLLYVYAPNAPANEWQVAYEEYYPGDDLVDIVGFVYLVVFVDLTPGLPFLPTGWEFFHPRSVDTK